jgi:hypothetical protein
VNLVREGKKKNPNTTHEINEVSVEDIYDGDL